MGTVSDMITRIQKEMGRGVEADVREQIVSAVTEHSREGAYFAKRQLMRIELVDGQQWYSVVGYREEGFATADEIEAETDVDSEDLEWSLDDFPYNGRASDILTLDFAGLQETGLNGQRWEVSIVPYADFERMNHGIVNKAQPTCVTLYGDQVGVYPEPDANYYLRLSGLVKPRIIGSDAGEMNSFISLAEELIRSGAKMRLCRDNYRDRDGMAIYGAAEQAALSRLRGEGLLRTTHVPIRPSGFC